MELTNLYNYGLITLLGLVISQMLDILSSGITWQQFSFSKWRDDNIFQLVTTVLCLVAALILADLVPGFASKMNYLTAFGLGLGSDAITNYIARRKRNLDRALDNQDGEKPQ